ncbi:MAG TPA: hypothetical protein VJK48_00375 [Chlamydiales bacterium]|nr:hypothetical protein [Chlamydiales bacterium]
MIQGLPNPQSLCNFQCRDLPFLAGESIFGSLAIANALKNLHDWNWILDAGAFILFFTSHVTVRIYGNVDVAAAQMDQAANQIEEAASREARAVQQLEEGASLMDKAGEEIAAGAQKIEEETKASNIELQTLREQLRKTQDELKEIQTQKENLERQIAHTMESNETLTVNLSELSKKNTSLAKQIAQLTQEIKSLREALQKRGESRLAESKKEEDSFSIKSKELLAKIQSQLEKTGKK